MFRIFRGNREKGFTLAEAMLATVVLGIAAAGVLLPFMAGTSLRAEGRHKTLAAKLAADLIEQIVSTDPNQIIAAWDGFNEDPGQVTAAAGNVFTDSAYSLFGRNASCSEVWLAQESDNDEPVFIRATVKVYYNGRETASISRLIAK